MPSLAETQAHLRGAMLSGDGRAMSALIIGGRDPLARLLIHLRHYEASLVAAIVGRFPACCWLLGEPFVSHMARVFVRAHPPGAPCIAEYGADFSAFLAQQAGGDQVPYLRWFGDLEWHLGRISVAIDHPALDRSALAAFPAEQLPDLVLTMQPGLAYIEAPWPVDALMKLHLSEQAPDTYEMSPEDVCLEVRGARGNFTIDRLDSASFAFRRAVSERATIGAAMERAFDAHADFDPAHGLIQLFADGLVTAAQ
jgi:hypothetical protein